MKLTTKHFDYFKKRTYYWQKELSLMNYELDFEFREDDKNRAWVQCNTMGRVATVGLNKSWETNSSYQMLNQSAFHEMCEIMLDNYDSILLDRGLDFETRQTLAHDVIRRLENLMFKK